MHNIAISEEIIAGAIAQRGKLHRYDELVAARTALVVIDMQNVFMLPGMPVEVPAAREIVPNVNRLAGAMRTAGGTVAWVRMTLAGQTENWSVFFQGDPRHESLEHMTPGSHGHALHAELDVRSPDLCERGQVAGAVNLPHAKVVAAKMSEYAPHRRIHRRSRFCARQ